MAGVVLARIQKNKADEVRVALEKWAGKDNIDIRVYVKLSDPSGEIVATRKGVSLPVAKIPDLLVGIQAAQTEAIRLGLLKAP